MFGIKALKKRVAELEALEEQWAECAVCGAVAKRANLVHVRTGTSMWVSWREFRTKPVYCHVHKHCIGGSAYDRREKPRKRKA